MDGQIQEVGTDRSGMEELGLDEVRFDKMGTSWGDCTG